MRSLVMTTGELDYSDTFRFEDDGEDIHYDAMTNILWVLFIILMPILFANLLVSTLPVVTLTNGTCTYRLVWLLETHKK